MQPLIEFQKTGFTIASGKKIIRDFSAKIYPGDFVVIVGSNGSGKSTLLKLINQAHRYTSGDIIFQQRSLNTYSLKTLQKNIVTLTQFIADSIFLDLTIEENAILIGSSDAQAANQRFIKKDFLSQLPHYLIPFHPTLGHALKTRVRNLSGGEQQILAFALYLRHQPTILLLDEHTSALDPKKSDHVMTFTHQFIVKHKITCLMTTHELQYALQYGNKLIALRDGQLAFEADSPKKLSLTLTNLLQHCY